MENDQNSLTQEEMKVYFVVAVWLVALPMCFREDDFC